MTIFFPGRPTDGRFTPEIEDDCYGGLDPLIRVKPPEFDWELAFQWGDFLIPAGGDTSYACTCRFLGLDEEMAAHFDADPKCPVKGHLASYRKRHGRED